ncbi:MAG: BON domain-containing protein [Chloroherpetonaceae bacterium]|nr:BON domain-containing protein [Chthonomonadaceae bacterium]MDW8208685.1 BON domain-containing protein [Chloroherpetonaceae bacterium]
MTATITRRDVQTREAVSRELQWDRCVDDRAINIEVQCGVVTLTGKVGSYAQKMAAVEAARRVNSVLDVIDHIAVIPAPEETRNDEEIARAIREGLGWNARLAGVQIQVEVSDGQVTLRGEVPFLCLREYAGQFAGQFAGVRQVINEIEVRAAAVEAGTVKQAIEEALDRYAAREKEHIQVAFENGTVTLTGWVYHWDEKQAALRAASFAPGVQRIEDHLRINPFF